LNDSKQKIEEVNASLEQRVIDNTKRNLDLSKSIIEQEKLATIGEISAGIAHDLNTPLGTIKVGSDNVRFMLSSLLKNELGSLSKEDLELIHNRVETIETEMFVGGLQLRREKLELLNQISIDYSNIDIEKSDKVFIVYKNILSDIIDFEKSISNKIQHFPNLPKKDERDILISEILKEIKENL
jgi:signal transduction histidine kinase